MFRPLVLLVLLVLPWLAQAAPLGPLDIVSLGSNARPEALDPTQPIAVGMVGNQAGRFAPATTLLGFLDPAGQPTSQAHSIQGSHIVGRASLGATTHAWRLALPAEETPGSLIDLGTLGAATLLAVAATVNASDTACGWGELPTRSAFVPTCWDSAASISQLPTLQVPPTGITWVQSLNDAGAMVGGGPNMAGQRRCLYWEHASATPVEIHPDPAAFRSFCVQITNGGLIAGNLIYQVLTPDGITVEVPQGFVGTPTLGWTLLPPLPGDTHTLVNGVTDSEDAVGQSLAINPTHPQARTLRAVHFDIAAAGVATDLATLLTTPGWTLQSAQAINGSKAIAVLGTFGGTSNGAILTPVPPPAPAPRETPPPKKTKHDKDPKSHWHTAHDD